LKLIMKRFLFLGTAVLTVAFACWLCLPRANAQPTAGTPTASQQAADVQRYNQLIQSQEDRAKRAETMLARQEALLARSEQLVDKQEAAFARYQKILDTWEQQQKQYQKYLDTLPK
jgi:ribulose kinase